MTFLTFFRSPYPSSVSRWKAVVWPAVIIFFILWMLQPFGISQMENGKWLSAAGSAGVAAAASAVFNYLLPLFFPRYYAEERWTVGKYIVNLLGLFVLIAVGVCLWVSWLIGVSPGWRLFAYSLVWVLLLAPFPTVFFVMWDYNTRLRRNLREAMKINEVLARKFTPPAEEKLSDPMLHLEGTTKESLTLPAAQLLYAESEGNYLRIVYLPAPDGKPAQRLLRLTLKQAEEAVSVAPSVMRCHRAYLVNLSRVERVDGNSQGYRLRLAGCADEVPVSRAYAKAVKERLSL